MPARWGGLLSLGAKVHGVAGVVADGPLRDVDEASGFDFPVFSRSLTARTARGRVVEIGTDVPVRIGDVTVQPGDYVLADRSGGDLHRRRATSSACSTPPKTSSTRKPRWPRPSSPASASAEVMGGNYEHMLKRLNHEHGQRNVERAAKLDTATLSDALDKLGIVGQCYRIKPREPQFRMTGRAFTLLYGPASTRPARWATTSTTCRRAASIVLDNGGPTTPPSGATS